MERPLKAYNIVDYQRFWGHFDKRLYNDFLFHYNNRTNNATMENSKSEKQIQVLKSIHKLNIRSVLFSSAKGESLTRLIQLHEKRRKITYPKLVY